MLAAFPDTACAQEAETLQHIRRHGFALAADAFAADGMPANPAFALNTWRVFEASEGDVFLDIAMFNRAYRAPRTLGHARKARSGLPAPQEV